MNQPDPRHQGFLHTDNLVKRFDEVIAVDEVSISIQKGEIFALLGSSGCGKSTLLRMMAGFEKPTSGKVFLDGVDIASFPPYERPINMMFQSYALFPHLNIWDNIAFGLKREGMPAPQIKARVEEMLNLVQLTAYAKRKPHQLSGGQQQRVALARSLAKKPQLLLLDEPLGALDKKLRQRTQFELVNIIESVGVTVVMVTHDQAEALAIADRVVVMNKGRIEQVGSPADIYRRPASRFVAEFVGEANWLNGERAGERSVRIGRKTLALSGRLPAGEAQALFVRPEDVILHERWEEGSNRFLAELTDISFAGAMTQCRLAPQGMPGVELRADFCPSMLSRRPVRLGDTVAVELPADRLLAYAADGRAA